MYKVIHKTKTSTYFGGIEYPSVIITEVSKTVNNFLDAHNIKCDLVHNRIYAKDNLRIVKTNLK